ncbi:MAG: DNA repair protein RecN [Alphaproteobacteria bacterium]|nr:DNA repair protein RecN [Alphaproteobacteria bacterium]
MLTSLSIRDFVLIERLDLEFDSELSVLTGETGAGKSILLDALGLATGGRAERGFIRPGATNATVSAVFEPPRDHPARAALKGNGLDGDGPLIFRRSVGTDGRTRAFINDQPISIGLMREAGGLLLEVHGQHDDRGLLDAAGHRALLDAFGGLSEEAAAVEQTWRELKSCEDAEAMERELQSKTTAEQEYLQHMVDDLKALAPRGAEETELAAQRTLMMASEKIAVDLNEATDALTGHGGIESRLNLAIRRLARAQTHAQGKLDDAVAALERAAVEATEARTAAEKALRTLAFDPRALEQAETRLFALRASARKYGGTCDGLPAKLADAQARLKAIESAQTRARELAQATAAARMRFDGACTELSGARRSAATQLDARVAGELGPLKLDRAQFKTSVEALSNDAAGAHGRDRVEFLISTNPGAPFGALSKIASGGELARFILALKVALAAQGSATTLIFDEVDRGVGGAVADAVGERLARLAANVQVLVVTHSPQVAARGRHHLRVAKAMVSGNMTTFVETLDSANRREEVARMLAGAKVTDEARAAADKLLAVVVDVPAKRRRAT